MNIVTAGELLVDLTQTGADENEIPCYAANPGGAPANVAVAASLMGCKTAFIGKVGNDSFGKMLINVLKSKNVDISGICFDENHPTTMAVVSVDPRGERSFSFYRKDCADVSLECEEADLSLIDNCDIFHFGSVSLTDEPSKSTVKFLVEYAYSKNKIISYDPNYRPLLWNDKAASIAEMRSLLKFVDIIKVSDDEAFMLTGKSGVCEAAEVLLKEGIKIVLVTMGEKGAYYLSEYADGFVQAFTGKVADTNGAGDTFLGAFLSEITDFNSLCKNFGNSLENSVRFACGAAGLSTTKCGAIPSMPGREQTLNFIHNYGKQ